MNDIDDPHMNIYKISNEEKEHILFTDTQKKITMQRNKNSTWKLTEYIKLIPGRPMT